MRSNYFSYSSLFVLFYASLMSTEAICATPESIRLPVASQSMESGISNRAKVEVAIRRIKSLLIVEKGQNDATFEAYTAAQRDLQGRR